MKQHWINIDPMYARWINVESMLLKTIIQPMLLHALLQPCIYIDLMWSTMLKQHWIYIGSPLKPWVYDNSTLFRHCMPAGRRPSLPYTHLLRLPRTSLNKSLSNVNVVLAKAFIVNKTRVRTTAMRKWSKENNPSCFSLVIGWVEINSPVWAGISENINKWKLINRKHTLKT